MLRNPSRRSRLLARPMITPDARALLEKLTSVEELVQLLDYTPNAGAGQIAEAAGAFQELADALRAFIASLNDLTEEK